MLTPCAACHSPTERGDLIDGLCGRCFGAGAPCQLGPLDRLTERTLVRAGRGNESTSTNVAGINGNAGVEGQNRSCEYRDERRWRMTSQEQMEKLLNDQKKRELGERLVSLLMESYIEAHKIGQESMRDRAAKVVIDTPKMEAGLLDERMRALPIE